MRLVTFDIGNCKARSSNNPLLLVAHDLSLGRSDKRTDAMCAAGGDCKESAFLAYL